MSSLPFTTFAFAGAGASLEYMIDSLLDEKRTNPAVAVRILTRESSAPKPKQAQWLSNGATLHTVSYTEPLSSSLLEALASIDVCISGIGIANPRDQIPLANAANEAGVRLFVPFEYGADASDVDYGLYGMKVAFRKWLDGEGGWKGRYIRLHTGWYSDAVIGEWLEHDVFKKDGQAQIHILGDGKAPCSFTSRRSIGSFMGHVLAATPASRLLSLAASPSPALRIESERISLIDLANLITHIRCDVLGPDVSDVIVTQTDSATLRRMSQTNPDDFDLNVKWVYDQGLGVVSREKEGNWRAWWDGWEPESIEDVVREKFRALL